ncbi:MAG TPA: formate dehydrogenase accessory sulfurtransferase FdhD [Ferruginibacter sp.]|jgi:FdhD protein|nr:formate dehydrogenase accessory sulfurtransferase FdhD [Ferruginibacter sp.]
MTPSPVQQIIVQKASGSSITNADDKVAVEEPLEIQLEYSTTTGSMRKNIAVTMRTPGHDAELAAGFLFTEGVIPGAAAIQEIKQPDGNEVLVILKENFIPVLGNTARNFYTTSSCGVCGKASIDAIRTNSQYADNVETISIEPSILYPLQSALKEQQKIFEDTGGIHASALFDLNGKFLMLREDVGRHNALDKLIGTALLNNQLPLNQCILLLSGRASFELVQKAVMGGIKIIAAVGAPSSLAVEMAKEMGVTLVGFLKHDRFNIYSGEERITKK